MSFNAQILADSLSPQGDRITTMKITFPRMVLAEFNTHRMFSRNSASSRAIPFAKMVQSVKDNPFVPIAWQKEFLYICRKNRTMYIYKTTNLVNGKIYIGKRVYRKKDDNWYLGSGIYLNRAIKKYGRKNFKKEILEWCNNKFHLCEREIYWINQLNATNPKIGYNLSLGGDGGNVGKEAYIKIKNKLKGKKKSKEFGEKVSEALKGKPKSKEHNEKVRQALLGKPRPKEVVNKMAKSMKNKYDNGWESPVQIEVHQYNKITGDYIQSYKSATEAGRVLNIDRKAITNNCVGKSKSSGGFIWSKIKKENIYE